MDIACACALMKQCFIKIDRGSLKEGMAREFIRIFIGLYYPNYWP